MRRGRSRTGSPSRSTARQGCTSMTKGSVVSSSTSSARVAPGLLARRLVRLTAGLAVAWLLAGTMARAQQAAEPAELAQARQLFDALDYEQALPLLDRAVA